MEQLTTLQQQTQGRLIEVSMLMKKVEIRISKEQLASLGRIMGTYLANLPLTDINDKAIFFLLYGIYESKVRKKQFSLKQQMKVSLDLPQAWAMAAMMQEVNLAAWQYENSLKELIIREINHQTA